MSLRNFPPLYIYILHVDIFARLMADNNELLAATKNKSIIRREKNKASSVIEKPLF